MNRDHTHDPFLTNGYAIHRGLLAHEVASLAEATRPTRWRSSGLLWFTGEPVADHDINAVHFPHLINPVIDRVGRDPALLSIVDDLVVAHLRLGNASAELYQSMYYEKPPGTPGQAWHQDEWFSPTADASSVTAWIAIDPADEENGCVWVGPGSHADLVVHPHERVGASEEHVDADRTEAPADPVPLTLEPGDVALFSGHTVHGSERNRSHRSRRSLVLSYRRAGSRPIAHCTCPGCGQHVNGVIAQPPSVDGLVLAR